MIKFGKTSQQALVALTSLAAAYNESATPIRAERVASERNLSSSLVSKLLGALAIAGITNSSCGPSGGFWLARPPDKISLLAVVRVFEPNSRAIECPIDSCHLGDLPPCAFGKELERQRQSVLRYLSNTTLADLLHAHPHSIDSNRALRVTDESPTAQAENARQTPSPPVFPRS